MPFSAQNAAAVAAMFGGGSVLPQHVLHCASIAAHNFPSTTTQQQQLNSTTKTTTNQQQRLVAANLAANIRFANMCQFFPSTQQILTTNDKFTDSNPFLSMFQIPQQPLNESTIIENKEK